MNQSEPCIAILGGGFDPVHSGHVAVADTICHLLKPTQLRIIPTGWSKQKTAFQAGPADRLAMLSLAFKELTTTALVIDDQEINRAEHGKPSYSVDTLANLRFEFGPRASLVFIIGTDQLQQLQHWKNWEHLLDLAHILVASRPGFDLDSVDSRVAWEFAQRAGSISELRNRPFGCTCLCNELNVDISSTEIRNHKQNKNKLSLVPTAVLDYIQQHHLY